jgi:hypothetical protein
MTHEQTSYQLMTRKYGVHTRHSISDQTNLYQDQARFEQLPTNEDSKNKGADNLIPSCLSELAKAT